MKVYESNISFLQKNAEDNGLQPHQVQDDGLSQQDDGCSIRMDIEKELQRLQSLRTYHVLEDKYQASHRRFTSIAARYFHAPLSKIVLVDMERCWSLACTGDLNEERDTPRWGSIYDEAVRDHAFFYCIKDMESDVHYQKMRNTSKLEEYRFFASTPLITREGYRIGVLTVMDFEPRSLPSVEDVIFLKDTASSLMELLELKRSTLQSGVNQSSASLLRSARFVRQCIKDIQDDDDLQTVIGEQQKEILGISAKSAEIMCGAFASAPDQKQATNQKLVKESLCGMSPENSKTEHC